MAGGEKDGFSIFSLLFFLFLLLFPAIGAENVTFTPPDLYLLDCGSPKSLQLPDGRTFRSEPQSSSFLSTDEDIRLSSSSPVSFPISALYLTARVFSGASTYSFYISKLGLHFLRLHFFPFPSPSYNLSSAIFTVSTQDFVLLRDFSLPTSPLIKEYLIEAKTERLCIIFKPSRGSFAFINALEVVSAPDSLIPTAAAALSPQEPFSGINNYALELVARINAGGGQISPENDPLARSWLPDSFLTPPQAAKSVAVSPEKVRYPADGSVTPLVAPRSVYATADTMASSNASQPLFNVTWQIPVIAEYSYLIRLHFCDIVSRSPNSLYFNVFINGILAIPNLDLSSLTGGNLAMAYCKDFVVQGFAVISGTISVQISPPVMNDPGLPNAILNGIEVMKMSNRAGSLDGPYSVDGSYHGASKRHVTVVVVGLILGAVGLALVVFMFVRWQRMRKAQSLAVWLSPLTACTKGPLEFAGRWSRKESSLCSSSKNGAWKKGFGSQHKSKSGYTSFLASGGLGLGRWFSFAELQQATGSFSEKNMLGVGGFGKVYLGELQVETGTTKVAVKRGNPSSDQGVNEFLTEIEMLSKLRHRHLVSLIGCCDENKEMILVYEFMSKGPLRDHLYHQGAIYSSPPTTPLSWKQRLEVCIGAARGLHYLHTGASQGIIHRDVKSTNILLDDKLVAKMADFGLSKAGPSSLDQTHVSTAVKGSFGYLDPEYFRRQQLTDKSDVYSFGVVMLEVLCARPAINPALPRDQVNLAEWAMHWHRKGHIDKIVDPFLAGVVAPASLKKFVESAEKCLADSGVDRPPMGEVLWNLEYSLQLQEAWIDEAKKEGEDGPSDIGNAGGEIDLLQRGDPQKKESQFEDEVFTGDSRDSSFVAGPAHMFHGR